jgi:hypothetical protein
MAPERMNGEAMQIATAVLGCTGQPKNVVLACCYAQAKNILSLRGILDNRKTPLCAILAFLNKLALTSHAGEPLRTILPNLKTSSLRI